MRTYVGEGDERGMAMAVCLCALAVLMGLTVAAQQMSRSDIRMAENYRSANQSLYAAEAGLRHAIAIINQVGVINLTSDVIDSWPNHRAPFSANPTPLTRAARFTYDVTIASDPYYPGNPNRGVLTATGSGYNEALRAVVTRIVRSGVPNAPPGGLYLGTDAETNATFNGNAFRLDGNDKYDGVPGPKPPVPAIATRTPANAEEARSSLSAQQKGNVQGLGYVDDPLTPSVAAAPGPTTAQISQMINDLLTLPHVTYSDQNVNGRVTFGTPEAPQITYFNNADGTTIRGAGDASGVGILIVEHALVIEGTFDFKGLVLVRGTTEVTEVTGHASVQGSLWTTDFNLTVGGSAVVQYSSQALELANLAGGGSGALPAPVVITAWRDEF